MALANFGSAKLCKVKKAYFMIKEIDPIGEKQPVLIYTHFVHMKLKSTSYEFIFTS